jgi:hypothetical protein
LHHIDGTELVSKKVTKHRFRKAIIAEWDGRCAYCNCRPERLTLDHVKPALHGGLKIRENLVPACRRCNLNKAHSHWVEWFRAQGHHCPAREARIEAWVAGAIVT